MHVKKSPLTSSREVTSPGADSFLFFMSAKVFILNEICLKQWFSTSGLQPLLGQKVLSQGLPKTIGKHQHLYHDS